MSQSLPDVPLSPETTTDQAHVATLLRTASAHLADAFERLRYEAASPARYEIQTLIYLAREEIDAALGEPDETSEEPTDA